MRKHFVNAILMTSVTTLLLGVIYPLVVTGLAQLVFPRKANGQLVYQNGKAVGSRIIGQPFTGPEHFHSRPSAAGSGYDAAQSGGSNLAPTNSKLRQRVADAIRTEQESGNEVPIDLVTTSASGLDPDITPAAAWYQIGRIAQARGIPEQVLQNLVARHTKERQLGFLGEARVNVLELNLELDAAHPKAGSR